MAYGLKYWNEFSSEDNHLYRLEILADAYTGLTNKIDLDANPVVIRRGSQNQNKYAAILGSSLTFNVIGESPLQWIEFFTSNDKAYRVNLYKNGSIYWTGYVQTDIYTEPYRKGRYVVQVTANDGFANLKDLIYDASLMTTVNGGYNITIDEWLRKNLEDMETFNFKDSDFYLFEAVDLELDNAPVNTSPLTYLHIGATAKDGEKVYDILNGIIDSFACRIFQKDAAIFILPIDRIYQEEITYRYRVDDAGGLDPTYTEVTIDNLKRVGRELTWVNDDQIIEIVPAFNEIKITNSADVPLIIDSPMTADDWSGGTTLNKWTATSFNTVRQADEFSQDGTEFYLKSEVNQTQLAHDIVRVGFGQASTWVLDFEYFVKTAFDFEYDQTTDDWRIEFQLFSKIENGVPDFAESVLESDNSLVPIQLFNDWLVRDAFTINVVVTKIEINSTKDLNKWVKTSFSFHPLNNEFYWGGDYVDRLYTELQLKFYGLKATANSAAVEEVYYRNFKLSYSDATSYPIKTYSETVTTAANITQKFEKRIMFDSRQADFATEVFVNQFYNDNNKLAFLNDDGDFIDAGKFYFFSGYNVYLSGLVANRMAINYTSPSIKINGSIRGDLHLDSVVRDPNFPMKKFMVNFIEENLKAGVKQVEIIEIAEPL